MRTNKHPLNKAVKSFPASAGVYLMKDKQNQVLYVGKAKNLKLRVQSYFKSASTSVRHTFLMSKVDILDYILTHTEAEALLLEANLIKKYAPRYNIRLKDDKSYPYICCSIEEKFPRFYIQRRVKKKEAAYFGPYTDAGFARKMIRFLNRQFQIRDCSNHFMRGRVSPCLMYQMGQCTAPCVDKVTPAKYKSQIAQAVSVLKNGISSTQIKKLEKQMQLLASRQQFEKAARIRDSIKALEFICEKQSIVLQKAIDLDILTFYEEEKDMGVLFQTLHVRAGSVVGNRSYFIKNFNLKYNARKESYLSLVTQYYMDNVVPETIVIDALEGQYKSLEQMLSVKTGQTVTVHLARNAIEKKLMQLATNNARSHFKDKYLEHKNTEAGMNRIRQKLHLVKPLHRMECFDISHFQGDATVASQVVFVDGLPQKTAYKKYRLKLAANCDDYLALQEVLLRRFKNKKQENPDLVVIDGGKAQLAICQQLLKKLGLKSIPIVAMAKARVVANFKAEKVDSSPERFFIHGRKNPIVFTRNSEDQKALHILTHLRNEAHRFAITYHRRELQKSLLTT